MRLVSLLAAVLLLVLAGCGGDDRYDGESLERTRWLLVSGVETPPDTLLTLGFGPDTTGGWTGCNSFTVEYETDGDSITIGEEVMSTAASCDGTPAGTTEETYLSLFFAVDGWRIEDGELVLSSDGRGALRYAPRSPRARELVERLNR